MPLIEPLPLREAFARLMTALLLLDNSISPEDVADYLLELLRSGKLRSERFGLRRNYRHVLTRSDWERWKLYPQPDGSVEVRRLDNSIIDQDDEWFYFVEGAQFDRLCPEFIVSESDAPARDESSPVEIEYEMIRAILARAFPGKGPGYAGIRIGDLTAKVRDGWNAEAETREMQHLIRQPPDRWKVGRAIGRYPPR